MRAALERSVFLLVLAACHREAKPAAPDPPPPTASASASAAPSAVPSAVASAAAAPAAPPIDAGPFVESTSTFGGAAVTPLRVELLPSDQRARDDGKRGFARIASVAGKTPGLATFGFATCDDSSGGHCWAQGYARPASARPLARASAPAVAFATYRAQHAPDPTPSLLVLEDSARAPVAARFVGVTLDVAEVSLFDDAPAFFVRRYPGLHAWGFQDQVDLEVDALLDGELARVLRVSLGFREADPCDDGKGMRTQGPPGSVTITARGEHPVLHVREAAADCDAPYKLTQGCAGVERDWDWDAAKKTFVPRGPGTKITLRATPKGC